jgi:hypothetical protein
MNKIRGVVSTSLLLSALLWFNSAAGEILQSSTATTGNQDYSGVGVRFDVLSTITVSQLGIFDSGDNGIAALESAPLSTYLFTSGGAAVASATFFDTSPGTDGAGNYRYKAIAPVDLGPGTYVLFSYGWTYDPNAPLTSDPLFNCNVSGTCGTAEGSVFNNGGGLLSYGSSVWGSGGDLPGTLPALSSGATNYFAAGNMEYVAAIPEPEIYAMLAAGLGVMGYFARRRRQAAGA